MSEKNEVPKKKLSTGAKVAIGCGAITLLGIILFVILGALGIAGLSKVVEEVDNELEETTETEEVEEAEFFEIGDVVTVGDIDWEVLSAANIGTTISSENMFIDDCVTNSGEFIDVVVKVTNNRDEMYTITGVRVEDNQGRRFTESSDAYMCVDDSVFLLENINPGISKTFRGIFEVPADAEGLALVVDSTGSVFSGETIKYISLGL
jgi:hypothetical protein